jgi:Zn finger protein HypA/HybF involved in hydrogenase expression
LVPCFVGVSGALFKKGIGDLMVDVLLLESVLVRELHMAAQIFKAGSLAKAHQLVVEIKPSLYCPACRRPRDYSPDAYPLQSAG